MTGYRKIIIWIGFWALALTAKAQEYHGTTGLLHMPSAEIDSAGTFRAYAMFLDKHFTPDQLVCQGEKYNTFGYGVGIVAFKWLQLSYSATLLKYVNSSKGPEPGYYNEDRHVNIRVIPLYEGKWWPSIAVGMDDVDYFSRIKEDLPNNYFQNIYIAASKHFDIKGYELGAHLAYRYYTRKKNKDMRGVSVGATLRPAFYRPLRVVLEWDGRGVNFGADVLLWRHLFVEASLIHGCGFTGGLGYHYVIPF